MAENDERIQTRPFPVSSEVVESVPGIVLEELEPKVDRESAEAEFARFVNLMALDVDETTLEDEDKKGLRENKRHIIDAIMAGSLVVNDKGEPIFTPARADSSSHHPIIFHEPAGSALMEMDRKADGKNVGKIVDVMASITKTNPAKLTGLKNPDFKVCLAVTLLYLG